MNIFKIIALFKTRLNYSRDEILYKVPYSVLAMELLSLDHVEEDEEDTEPVLREDGRPELNLF